MTYNDTKDLVDNYEIVHGKSNVIGVDGVAAGKTVLTTMASIAGLEHFAIVGEAATKLRRDAVNAFTGN